jgi:hypothetical protein
MAFVPAIRRASRQTTRQIQDDVPRVTLAHTLGSGLLAGEVAGLVMAGSMMAIYSFVLEKSPFLPLQIIGTAVYGSAPTEAVDPLGFVAGLAVHQLVPALVWGLIFGALVSALRPSRSWSLMFLGLGTGALAQIVDVYILLPHAKSAFAGVQAWATDVHPLTSWLVHLVYGLALSFFPWKYDPASARFA